MNLTAGRIVHLDIAKMIDAGAPFWAPAVCTYRYGPQADLFLFPSSSWSAEVVTVSVLEGAHVEGAGNVTWRWPPREE